MKQTESCLYLKRDSLINSSHIRGMAVDVTFLIIHIWVHANIMLYPFMVLCIN